MSHLSRHSHVAQAGASLLSIVIGVAFGGIAIATIAVLFKNSEQLRRDFARRDVLGSLEARVRSSIRFSMDINTSKNSALDNCTNGVGVCPSTKTQATLWVSNGDSGLVTRTYKMNGEPCSSKDTGCDIVVAAEFMASCASPPCQPAEQITFYYNIKNNNTVLRQGVEWYAVIQNVLSDDVHSCPSSTSGSNPQFLSKRTGGELVCIDIAKAPSGGVASQCQRGKQILAGIDEKGQAICEDIVFK